MIDDGDTSLDSATYAQSESEQVAAWVVEKWLERAAWDAVVAWQCAAALIDWRG